VSATGRAAAASRRDGGSRRDDGSIVQRVRARLIAAGARIIAALPDRPVDALADAVGELWYRADTTRASLGRRNLERVVRYLAARGLGGSRVATAAVDGAALERMLRATFRQTVRYYLDMARLPSQDPSAVDRRLRVETPDAVAKAFGEDKPAIIVAMHFGAVEYPALFAVAHGGPIVTPMETLGDPALQAWIRRTRGSVGVQIVGLREARHALFEALEQGVAVGLVADRHVAGGSVTVPFFGAPAPLPPGPAFLAVETGRPIYLAAVRRLGRGRYAGGLTPVPIAADSERRERIAATAAAIAAEMERAIAVAPEQWWSLLAPIWPDVDARAIEGTGELEPEAPA
jgi:phosphatidylinositol dimannoside acyltransferase